MKCTLGLRIARPRGEFEASEIIVRPGNVPDELPLDPEGIQRRGSINEIRPPIRVVVADVIEAGRNRVRRSRFDRSNARPLPGAGQSSKERILMKVRDLPSVRHSKPMAPVVSGRP